MASRRRATFNPKRCAEKVLWCGDGDLPPPTDRKIYLRAGTRSECLRIGIGAGIHQEKRKGLPPESLQTIKFIGPVHEKNFLEYAIRTTADLIHVCRRLGPVGVSSLLGEVLVKKGGGIDTRAFNSVCWYLYEHGVPVEEIPGCLE